MKAEVYNVSYWIEQDVNGECVDAFEQALNNSGFMLLGKKDHHFEPVGYTSLWLLAESHFALHTFPEQNRSYIELCSCNKEKLLSFVAWLENDSQLLVTERYRHL